LFAAFWKWKEGDETVSYVKMDLISGKQEIDDEEKAYLAAQELLGPRPKWKKVWDAL
jgi:amino acid transporter